MKDYMESSEPYFAVGEYWDSLSYTYGEMDHNQDAHRQRIIDWINAANGTAGAFDVTTKGILHSVSIPFLLVCPILHLKLIYLANRPLNNFSFPPYRPLNDVNIGDYQMRKENLQELWDGGLHELLLLSRIMIPVPHRLDLIFMSPVIFFCK